MTPADWDAVRAIYVEGIATGHATFEPSPPPWEKWDAGHLPACRLVAHAAGGVLGWAALSPVSGRCVYAGVAEVSVYVASRARGRGAGSRSSPPSSRLPKPPVSGPCRPASSLKTPPASHSTAAPASAWWALASASAKWTATGATWS